MHLIMKNKVYEKMLQSRVKRGDCYNILIGGNDQQRNEYHNINKQKQENHDRTREKQD